MALDDCDDRDAIAAVIFDLDGTLVDSEVSAERAVTELLKERQLPDRGLDRGALHGITWRQVEAVLLGLYPELRGEGLAVTLQHRFHRLLLHQPPAPIPGSPEAVMAAARILPTAIASSGNRESVEHVIDVLGLTAHVGLVVCAEDCTRSKPDPQCYQITARRLARAPQRCLVFEDSIAGLRAARAAGMRTVAITRGKQAAGLQQAQALADRCIQDFTALPKGFFAAKAKGAL